MKSRISSGIVYAVLSVFAMSCSAKKAVEGKEIPVVAEPAEEVKAPEPEQNLPEVTPADFRRAVQTAVRNMTRSGALDNPSGERYVVTVSHIIDVTKKGFDTEDIVRRLQADLAASRKVRVVSVSAKNVSPQINIAGRITQRTAYVRGGRKRQEYYLHLVMTEAKSGMELWENVTPVVNKK